MTGQGYAARETPNYGLWLAGALVILAVVAGLWFTLGRDSEPVPTVSATSDRPQLPRRPLPVSAPPLVSEPALSSGAEGTALSEGSSEADLRTHIADLEAALATERGRSEEYKANYVRVAENLNAAIAQNEYYRNAIELALQASRHGATVAAYQPYLPEPAILPTGVIGGTYRLIGRVYNGSSTKVVGIAILELVVDGSVATSKRVSVQVEAGTYTPYDVSIPLNIYGRSITVRPRARWEG